MADDKEGGEKGGKAGGGGKLGWVVTAVVAGGLGAAVPYVLPANLQPGQSHAAEVETTVDAPPSPAEDPKPAYIDFGQITANLDEGRLTRYIQINIWLQVTEKEKEEISAKVTANDAVLRNWLNSYLSDQDLEGIRGAIGQNRLRREIRDQFNTVLFPDGYDRIDQVLFQAFNVQ